MWFGRTLLVSNDTLNSKKTEVKEDFYSSSGHSLFLSYNLFSFKLPELCIFWKSKYFNKLAQEHCSILDTSISLMLRSNPALAFSSTAVCTSSNQSLFQCHFFYLRKQHNGWERNAPATCTLSWLILFCGQSWWKDWHWFVQYHEILRYETRCSIVHPLLCSEVNTASLEETALEKLYKRKGIACLQRLRRLTWCFPLAIQPWPC